MITARYYRLLPLLLVITKHNFVYAMHTRALAQTSLRKILPKAYVQARRFLTTGQAYKLFGLPSNCSKINESDLKHIVRLLSQCYHPDTNQQFSEQATEKFKTIQEAHKLIQEDQHAKQYGSASEYAPLAHILDQLRQEHTSWYENLEYEHFRAQEQQRQQQEQEKARQREEQRYQKIKNNLYIGGALTASAGIGYAAYKLHKELTLFYALTSGTEETIKATLTNNTLSDAHLQQLLEHAVEHNNYALFSAILEVLDKKNLGNTIQASHTMPNDLQELWNKSKKVLDVEQLKSIYSVGTPELKSALDSLTNSMYIKYSERTYYSYRQLYYFQRNLLKKAIIKSYKQAENLNIGFRYYAYGNIYRSLLHITVDFQDYELMSLLIKTGANPNIQGEDGETPLFGVQSPVVARFLINAGARTDVQNKDGNTPAHKALSDGNIALAQVLLSPEIKKIKNRDGKTPLQILCDNCAKLSLNSQPNTLELLDQLTQDKQILSQAQPNLTQTMRNQNTQDCVILARVLEDLAKDSTKTASELWYQRTSQARLKADFTDTIAHDKHEYYLQHRPIIQEFTQAGHDVNMPVTSGDSTLLHIAIYFNDIEMAQQLIQHGASVHVRNMLGHTPLFYAHTYTAYEFLKKQGASLKVKDSDNRSLLYLAMQRGYDSRLVSEYAHLEQNNPTQAWHYLIDACKDSTPQELMAKVQAYLAAAPTSLKNSDIKTQNYKFNSATESNCTTLVEVLKKLAQQDNSSRT